MRSPLIESGYHCYGFVLNVPVVFERADFQSWLNDPARNVATWHSKGAPPSEWSDVYILISSDYEGDSDDMPPEVWRALCDHVYRELDLTAGNWREGLQSPVVVRLTNI